MKPLVTCIVGVLASRELADPERLRESLVHNLGAEGCGQPQTLKSRDQIHSFRPMLWLVWAPIV